MKIKKQGYMVFGKTAKKQIFSFIIVQLNSFKTSYLPVSIFFVDNKAYYSY
jgi:hypothetical protein